MEETKQSQELDPDQEEQHKTRNRVDSREVLPINEAKNLLEYVQQNTALKGRGYLACTQEKRGEIIFGESSSSNLMSPNSKLKGFKTPQKFNSFYKCLYYGREDFLGDEDEVLKEYVKNYHPDREVVFVWQVMKDSALLLDFSSGDNLTAWLAEN